MPKQPQYARSALPLDLVCADLLELYASITLAQSEVWRRT
jgi:hypothetical protein